MPLLSINFSYLFTSIILLQLFATTSAHFIVFYPGWRGNSYPTQFTFPCGGVAQTTNRSNWPTNGGALSLRPIHAFALTTVNIAIGTTIIEEVQTNPFSTQMVPMFNQTGANETFCIPKINIPASLKDKVKNGVNATIQVIQLVATGAALYNCLDITFSDTEADRFGNSAVWDEYCFNGTGMGGKALGSTGPSINTTIVNAAPSKEFGLGRILGTVLVVALVLGAGEVLF
ncbi:hypothetical protein RUND412_004670 [Rhizina undulata]